MVYATQKRKHLPEEITLFLLFSQVLVKNEANSNHPNDDLMWRYH